MSDADIASQTKTPQENLEEGRKSALYDEHVALGAEMRNVGGYVVPKFYSDAVEEHHAVRNKVGIFDLSLMGQIRVTGPEAPSFLAHTLISAIKPIALGKAKYTMIVQEDGGIIDDLIVYRLGINDFMLVQNAGNFDAVLATLQERQGGYDVEIDDRSQTRALIAVQGPKSLDLMRKVVAEDSQEVLGKLPYFSCTILEVAGSEMIVARTGYTGEDGFELFPKSEVAAQTWRALLDGAKEFNGLPCGLACRDTLRLEAGMPLYGYELSRERTPLEVGNQSVMGPSKGHFIGRNALVNRPQPKQQLVGLKLSGSKDAETGAEVFDSEGNVVGSITSSKVSPTLGQPLAFAYIDRWLGSVGTELTVDIDGEKQTATVAPTPFYRRPRRK